MKIPSDTVRNVIVKSKRIVGMLQGTMGLEGQGLDKKTLKKFVRMTVMDILKGDSVGS